MSGNKKQRHPPSLLQRIDVRQEEIAAILERTRAVLSEEEHATLSSIVSIRSRWSKPSCNARMPRSSSCAG